VVARSLSLRERTFLLVLASNAPRAHSFSVDYFGPSVRPNRQRVLSKRVTSACALDGSFGGILEGLEIAWQQSQSVDPAIVPTRGLHLRVCYVPATNVDLPKNHFWQSLPFGLSGWAFHLDVARALGCTVLLGSRNAELDADPGAGADRTWHFLLGASVGRLVFVGSVCGVLLCDFDSTHLGRHVVLWKPVFRLVDPFIYFGSRCFF